MTALAAANVTVTVVERRIVGRKRRNICTVQFGDGALTYPTGGVPMPSAASFGLVRNLDFLNLLDLSADGFLVTYDKTNNKLKMFAETTVATNQPLIEATTALAPASRTYTVEAVGW